MKTIVYRTENMVNNNFYYGVHTCGRKCENECRYIGSGQLLLKAINKHGIDNFVRRTIMEFDTIEKALEFEELMVDEMLVTNQKCYNITTGGGMPPSKKGTTLSEETKRKIGEKAKGRKPTPEAIEKMRAAKLGKTFSDEHKAAIGRAHKGRVFTPEHREKIRITKEQTRLNRVQH